MHKINPKDFNLPDISDEYDVYISNLSEIPHDSFDREVDGKNGKILFYNVPKDLKVIALDDKNDNKLKWTDVSSHSEHIDRKVVIVDLLNGLQIITDDDPRAIYGIAKKDLYSALDNDEPFIFGRFTPSDALHKEVLVPYSYGIVNDIIPVESSIYNTIDICSLNESISTLNDALAVIEEFFIKRHMLLNVYYDNGWKLKIPKIDHYNKISFNKSNDDFGLTGIRSIQYTDVSETGYDLTVPGSETFLNIHGIVLSNTVNVHVPASQEAVDDIKEKLMGSKQIFSIRDPRNIVNLPKQEFILSAFSAANKKSDNKWIFNSFEEMMKALKEGKIKYSDEFVIIK